MNASTTLCASCHLPAVTAPLHPLSAPPQGLCSGAHSPLLSWEDECLHGEPQCHLQKGTGVVCSAHFPVPSRLGVLVCVTLLPGGSGPLSASCGHVGQPGQDWGQAGTLTRPLHGRIPNCLLLTPDSGRLPKASLLSIALGALLVIGLAGLTWTVICRW